MCLLNVCSVQTTTTTSHRAHFQEHVDCVSKYCFVNRGQSVWVGCIDVYKAKKLQSLGIILTTYLMSFQNTLQAKFT